jgi:DNA polymerase-3 subunit alpha/error-prone DNA polymerase
VKWARSSDFQKDELDALAKKPMQSHDKNSIVALVQKYGMMLEKYPNQRSMHSCGILISEEPITNYTTLEMPLKGFQSCNSICMLPKISGLKFDILFTTRVGSY